MGRAVTPQSTARTSTRSSPAPTPRQRDIDGLAWYKSSHSAGGGGECVEVASLPGVTHVRDSKDKAGPKLGLTPTAWTEFVKCAARHTA
ncbi:DUF397 domain-containing protein [Streptomyces sp. NPDC048392]|uniref:DUF397 domain-containing protein n=1 Tax=Streptomyces sp. NPDC048392 TaxID=3365543 RepID=UPI003720DDF0